MKNFIVELEASNVVVAAFAAAEIESALKARNVVHGVRDPHPATPYIPAKDGKPAQKAQAAEDDGALPMTVAQLCDWLAAQ